jgi:hypothetical protein
MKQSVLLPIVNVHGSRKLKEGDHFVGISIVYGVPRVTEVRLVISTRQALATLEINGFSDGTFEYDQRYVWPCKAGGLPEDEQQWASAEGSRPFLYAHVDDIERASADLRAQYAGSCCVVAQRLRDSAKQLIKYATKATTKKGGVK